MDLNRVTLIGNVVRDPESRTTPTGQTVVSFSIATNLTWTDKNGQRQQKAEFHNIVAWRKLAEIISQYVKKGSKIFLEGRLETRTWDDQNAIKHYRSEIIADNLIMLDRANTAGGSSRPQTNNTPAAPQSTEEPVIPVDEQEINVEDIPF
ncbi:MAG: single-stranded DNA-binding protein [Candidatus Komeilibacteria bacterium]